MKIIKVLQLDKIPTGTSQQQGIDARGKYVRTYPKKSLREARQTYCTLLSTDRPEEPLKGALKLSLMFYYGTKDKKKQGTYKTTKPDADNLSKVFTDCLAHTGYIDNDANVSVLSVTKVWNTEPTSKILLILEEVSKTDGQPNLFLRGQEQILQDEDSRG